MDDAFDILRIMTDLNIKLRDYPWLLLSNLTSNDFKQPNELKPRLRRFSKDEHQTFSRIMHGRQPAPPFFLFSATSV